MRWLLGYRRLKQHGVIGLNRRNADGILDHNPRSRFPIVDDKLLMAELCHRIGIPTPATLGVLTTHGDLAKLGTLLEGHREFALKPARGSGGRGILVVDDRRDNLFRRPNGRWVDLDGLRAHASDVLSGMSSLGGQPDRLLIQQRVRPTAYFEAIAPRGIVDVRVLLYRFEPAMAMLRLPTIASNGRANLHQGGIGVGLDLATGRTRHAVLGDRSLTHHPDTGAPLLDREVPCWKTVLEMSRTTARGVGLGFIGIDVVFDERQPLLLEANARPGLTIQLANRQGLGEAIAAIDRRLATGTLDQIVVK